MPTLKNISASHNRFVDNQLTQIAGDAKPGSVLSYLRMQYGPSYRVDVQTQPCSRLRLFCTGYLFSGKSTILKALSSKSSLINSKCG
jgi:putative component of toxin-antitoxin plasmid stabilization module